jgi:arylsulfatase A
MSAMIPLMRALFLLCSYSDSTWAMTTSGKDGANDHPKSSSWQNIDQPPPNIVIMFADNLGYNDIGWFQQQHEPQKTPSQQLGETFAALSSNSPNIDRLAQQGKTFYNWNSAAHLCSASRAALLTGKYPVRTGVYPGVFHNDAQYGLMPEEVTLAEALQEAANYSTSIVGKWHLGHRSSFLPTHQGFDHWLGIPYHMSGGSIDNHTCHNSMGAAALNVSAVWLPLYQDATIVQQPVQVQDIATHYAATATQFIRDQTSTSATTPQTKKNPFFLYLAFSHVHQLCAPRDFVEPETCQWSKKEGTSGRFETAVQEMDWVAGQVLQALEETGTVNNTIVIFTSDNGPWVAEQTCSGSKGPFHGQWYVVVTQVFGCAQSSKEHLWI